MPGVDPLSGLHEMAWASLRGPHHSSEDVPTQLTALRSADPVVRGRALNALDGAVLHQGTRWQVSAHVVPFLVRLIDDPGTPDRPDLTALLREIGLGDRRDQDLPFDPATAFGRYGAETVTAEQENLVVELMSDLEQEHVEDWTDLANACAEKWEADAYRATAARVDVYRRWLDDDHQEVASQAAELLTWLTPTDPVVAALLTAERSDAVRASANLALAHLNVSPAAVAERLTSLLRHHSLVVRITAAITAAYRLGPDLPGEALDILIGAKERETLPAFPRGWHRRAQRGYVALALQRLGLD
ncbi:hypothetical protein Areg01_82130 [Actinoplanes regularis]|nr:hypothetical protein Areg01_82130 [Actinoplanes regularis]